MRYIEGIYRTVVCIFLILTVSSLASAQNLVWNFCTISDRHNHGNSPRNDNTLHTYYSEIFQTPRYDVDRLRQNDEDFFNAIKNTNGIYDERLKPDNVTCTNNTLDDTANGIEAKRQKFIESSKSFKPTLGTGIIYVTSWAPGKKLDIIETHVVD